LLGSEDERCLDGTGTRLGEKARTVAETRMGDGTER